MGAPSLRLEDWEEESMIAPIADKAPAADGKPSIVYRHAGERAVLIEYGEMDLDLALNFFVLAVNKALRDRNLDGVIDVAPGFRSMLVRYVPDDLSADELLDVLRTSARGAPRGTRHPDPQPAGPPAGRPRRLDDAQGGEALHRRNPRRRPQLRGRKQHRLHGQVQRAREPRRAVGLGDRHRAVERVCRLLPRASVHVPHGPALHRVGAEVQPDPHVDGRGDARPRRPMLRDLPGRVPGRVSAPRPDPSDLRSRAQERGVWRQPVPAPARATG